MIRRIVAFALYQPLFIVLGLALFVGAGLWAFINLPVEAFPDVTDTQANVIALYPGRAAEEVEKQVTVPLEVALSGLPGAVRMFSHTQFGLSFLIVTFNDSVNGYFARQQAIERLQGVDLPDGVQVQLAPFSTAIGEIYRYRMKGQGQGPRELRTYQDWVVSRQLRLVPGVADVVTLGGLVKQYEVRPNLAKLRDYKITLSQLSQAIQRGNANAGGSYVEQGRQQYLIRGIGLFQSIADIESAVVVERGGTPILVKNVAQVAVGSVPRQGVAGQDDDDDIVTGVVLMRRGENPSEVLKLVRAKIDELNASGLPGGVKVVPIYDRTWLIGKTLTTVFSNLLEGALLVSLVLWLFLGNVRAAFIVALTIPLALLATFLGLTWIGIPANLLSLGAMDFGIIVDGAVIVVENVFRRLTEEAHEHHQLDDRQRKSAILKAAVEVGRPTLFSMLIIIAAHIPIFTLQRHEGRIFAPMAYSVVSALVGALVLSLTLVPLLCSAMLKKNLPEEDNFIVRAAKRAYAPALAWVLGRPRTILAAAVIALAASLALVPKLGSEFLPELNEGSIWVNVFLPTSVSVTEAQELDRRIRDAIRRSPEVATVTSKTGRPEDGTDPKLINMSEFLVDVKPQSAWRKGMTKAKLEAEMDAEINKIPGIDTGFSQPIRDNVLESISQIDGQIVIKVFGDDLDQLKELSLQVLKQVQTVPGVARAFVDRLGELPQIQVKVDRARAARYGINVADVQDVIESALGGKAVTQVWEGEQRFAVAVRLEEPERRLTAMQDLLIATPDGAYIPLSEVATFRTVGGLMNIARENGKRVFAIGVFIQGRDMGGVVSDMQDHVAENVKLPEGYSVTWSGEFENQERAMKRLAIIVPISILIIFLLLFDAFKSFGSALVIIANIPFSVIGGILALFITGIYLSVSAAIGFIALFGQAVLNGVVMVTLFNQLRTGGADLMAAVTEGAMTRLRTVLMTALLASLGLLPMALSTGIGSEVQKPLAVVVIGGLVTATLLVLFVLPVLYVVVSRRFGDITGRKEEEEEGAAVAGK
ncbi:MAG TPA: CusA/CzcA family heavy metal efflux RND transporter [Burkholderiales bacterium]|nr:CusA/CzcA family heavy metal efflux RND transporter [Burkholderiales bacterium]